MFMLLVKQWVNFNEQFEKCVFCIFRGKSVGSTTLFKEAQWKQNVTSNNKMQYLY